MKKKTETPVEAQEAATFVSIDTIHPWDQNPRKNSKAVREVMRSIKRFGFSSPIIARKANGEIIAGHTRYEAAKRLRLTTVPVRFMDLDESEAHVLALADNKLGEIAEWDDGSLGRILSDLDSDSVELELGTGFGADEIDKLLGFDEKDSLMGDAPIEGSSGQISIVIECESETHQRDLLERFDAEGLKCRALI